jgi:hypothetical protein
MARAKSTDCVRLVAALGQGRPSTREIGALYATWATGNLKTRALVITQPWVVLKARENAKAVNSAQEKRTPARTFLDDLGIIIGTSRRARAKLAHGLLAELLPTEEQEARGSARQARWECAAFFRAAAPLLDEPRPPPAEPAGTHHPKEPPDAR